EDERGPLDRSEEQVVFDPGELAFRGKRGLREILCARRDNDEGEHGYQPAQTPGDTGSKEHEGEVLSIDQGSREKRDERTGIPHSSNGGRARQATPGSCIGEPRTRNSGLVPSPDRRFDLIRSLWSRRGEDFVPVPSDQHIVLDPNTERLSRQVN